MESENTPINSKACVTCNNVESDFISVRLKGLQNLIEYNKIRSNGDLFILRNKRKITCQIKNLAVRIAGVIIPTLYLKTQTGKYY